VGLTGAAATGVTSALAAATSSMIKDMVNGQTPNGKKAAIAGAAALVIGAGIKAGVDAFSTDSIVDDGYSGSGEDVPSNRDSEIARFKSDTTTEFDGKSLVDRGAIKMQTAFKDVGLSDTGSNFGSQNIFRNFAQDLANAAPSMKMNPEEIADLVKITLQDMTPEQLSSISDEASLRGGSAIKKFIDIMTNNEGFNQVKAQKLQNFANRFVKKWQ
jgi:acyl CoA:acetate/3-ketoacid CoA transferase alpha subunit